MIDDPWLITAIYGASSAIISAAMVRFSPTIGPRLRTVFSAVSPLAGVYGAIIAREDTVTLHGPDLLFAAALIAVGMVTALLASGLALRSDKPALEN